MLKYPLLLLAMVIARQIHAQQKVLFLIAGQSNGVGQGDSAQSIHAATSGYEYLYNKNALKTLADPVGQSDLHFQPANTGSAWPAFARAYHSLAGQKPVLIPAARGGSSCNRKAELDNMGTWDTGGRLPLFDSAILKTKAALALTHLKLSGIIWSQGERDANAINAGQLTAAEYEQALKRLITRFRNVLGNKFIFYIIQTGYYRHHATKGFDEVRKVQAIICQTIKNVYLVYDRTGDFEQKGWMRDDIHYNQVALNEIGAAVAKKIARQNHK